MLETQPFTADSGIARLDWNELMGTVRAFGTSALFSSPYVLNKSVKRRKEREALRGQNQQGGKHQICLPAPVGHEHQIAQTLR